MIYSHADLGELNQDQERFEENSKMTGDKLEDEMRTKEDRNDDDNNLAKDGSDEHKPNQSEVDENNDSQEENAEKDENNLDDTINDDTEDKYEDKHDGVDVRNENAGEEDGDEDLGIDLNDGLNLDDGDESNPDNSLEDEGCKDFDDEFDEEAAAEKDGDDDDGVNKGETDPMEEEDNDDEEMSDPDRMEPVGQGGTGDEDLQNELDVADDEDQNPKVEPPPKSKYDANESLHGIAAEDGKDQVKEKEESPENDDADEGMADESNAGGAVDEPSGQSSQEDGGNGNVGSWQKGKYEEQNGTNQSEPHNEVPNPFRSPGDAEKFWHKRLDILQDSQRDDVDEANVYEERTKEEENMTKEGQYEYTMEGEENSGQVLGVAEEEQAMQLNEDHNDDIEPQKEENETNMDTDVEEKRAKSNSSRSNSKDKEPKQSDNREERMEDSAEVSEMETHKTAEEEDPNEESTVAAMTKSASAKTQSLDDASDDGDEAGSDNDAIVEMDFSRGMTIEDIQQARLYWQTIQSETNNLSRRLCEKLRLVMEPLVATKLRGDYRTGKRVNMKRIIGYIASGYRKDKIWLRRTKPAKRDYKVLIAVDDSESMQNGQAGDMALRALATLANGMSQLEIGQLGVASFGEDMKLIHPFNLPFTSESGVTVASSFSFNAKRTRTALCIESSIAALDDASSSSSSMQLVFMISDGRIERDSRSKVRRLIRQMSEKNMLMVMIIVEGAAENNKKNESILNMKEVSFVNGKPKIKHFIEDYPFPYYLVVEDLAALPEILGDALRQWFEMLAQIQTS